MTKMRSIAVLGAYLFCLVWVLSCGSSEQSADKDSEMFILCTTGMIADAVQAVAGTEIKVEALMGPGVDPHLYKATQADLQLMRKAEVIFYNGLHLEGKMGEVLEKLARQKPVYAISEGIPQEQLLISDSTAHTLDPHLWFDVSLWSEILPGIATQLGEHRPEQAAQFLQNAKRYQDSLTVLHQWILESFQGIPESQRVLITAHDAFGYFGRAYGVEVRGLQGISTVSEFGLKDIKALVDFIVSRKIKAVFVESSIPERSLEAVVQGCRQKGQEVSIGGTLYSDAMGASGTPEGTYLGMVRKNVQTIIQALQ